MNNLLILALLISSCKERTHSPKYESKSIISDIISNKISVNESLILFKPKELNKIIIIPKKNKENKIQKAEDKSEIINFIFGPYQKKDDIPKNYIQMATKVNDTWFVKIKTIAPKEKKEQDSLNLTMGGWRFAAPTYGGSGSMPATNREDNEFSGPDVISKPDKVELKPVGDVENVKNSPITEKMPIPTKIFKRIDIHEPKTPNKPVKFRPETYKAPRKVTVKEAVVIKTPGDKEVVVKASMSGTYVELGTLKSAAD